MGYQPPLRLSLKSPKTDFARRRPISMSRPAHALLTCALVCAAFLLGTGSGTAWGQAPAPTQEDFDALVRRLEQAEAEINQLKQADHDPAPTESSWSTDG